MKSWVQLPDCWTDRVFGVSVFSSHPPLWEIHDFRAWDNREP